MICEIGFPKRICIATVPLSMTITFRIADTSIMDVVHLNIAACGYDRDWSFLKAAIKMDQGPLFDVGSPLSWPAF